MKKKTAQKKTTKKTTSWPKKTEVLFRPQRWAYIKSQKEGRVEGSRGGCVFCEALNDGENKDSLVVHAGKNAMIVFNKFPYNLGHLLVLPKRHTGDLLSLNESEFSEFMQYVRVCVKVVKQAFSVEEFNLGANLGKGAGAGIPEHLHFHILPRWLGDTNFFPLIAGTKVLPGDLPTVYEFLTPKIKAELNK